MVTSIPKINDDFSLMMKKYRLIRFADNLTDAWEELVASSIQGTLLHTRKFLSYHGDRFDDQSVLIYDDKNILQAVFPAAVDLSNPKNIVSHPGATYGGLVHTGRLRGQRCLDVLTQLCDFYREAGFEEIIYKPVPMMYHVMPAQDDIYALFKLKTDRYRVDLSTTINTENRGILSERRIRSLNKARKHNLIIHTSFDKIESFWQILAQNLKNKYGKEPVHSVAQLCFLKEKFPHEIELITATQDNKVIAGTLLFYCPTLVHAQYFASNADGREVGALDLVIEQALENTIKAGLKFFDFGISTEKEGDYLNSNLYTYKCEFGACGSIYEVYKIKL
jgi:hypothetical protein